MITIEARHCLHADYPIDTCADPKCSRYFEATHPAPELIDDEQARYATRVWNAAHPRETR